MQWTIKTWMEVVKSLVLPCGLIFVWRRGLNNPVDFCKPSASPWLPQLFGIHTLDALPNHCTFPEMWQTIEDIVSGFKDSQNQLVLLVNVGAASLFLLAIAAMAIFNSRKNKFVVDGRVSISIGERIF
jgi:hypothetical protein